MKSKFKFFVALLALFSITVSVAQSHRVNEKYVIERSITVSAKEAYKVDDAEYTVGLVSKSNLLSGNIWVSDSVELIGAIALFTSIGDFFSTRKFLPFKEENPELEAVRKVAEQVDKFEKLLGDKIDKSELANFNNAIVEIRATIKTLEEKGNSKELETKLDLAIKTANEQLEKFGVQFAEFEKDLRNNSNRKKIDRQAITKQIEEFVKATFKDGKKTNNQASIRLKAAETFSIPDFFDGGSSTVDRSVLTGRFIDPTLYQRTRKRNLILDYFQIQTITVPELMYIVKLEVSGTEDSSEDVGSADWITSGAAKPKRSFRVTTGKVEAKKVAIFGTVEDKLLRDVPSLENWIQDDFAKEMAETYNDGLLNNNPEINDLAPLGLKNNAVQYVGSPAFASAIDTPTEIDAIVAMAADMGNNKEIPATCFIAQDTWYKLMVLKDANKRYQNNNLVYVNNEGQLFIAGIGIVGVDNEDIPAANLLMISQDVGFKIKNYGDLVFERGLNGTDFQNDRTSYRGFQEVLSYLPQHREVSVEYDTFANIIADITK